MLSRSWSALLALQRATHVTLDAVAAQLPDLSLPASELSVLANLVGTGPRTVSELAGDIGSRATTMTSTLDRLERRGYLRRRPHPDDRRAAVVELTTAGRRVARRVRVTMGMVEQEALAHLSPPARVALRQGLEALAGVPR